eukprot:TRINITY_DN1298_c0_g1_i1.p1 TRINITY_DN1298_c0_g1~~TRINITY_DN1298_c0_g1_i1.p1  ORF type:complete len:326 (+),score=40.60 TRINITY_DN1298_c0_g1_i1:362-1339(+)
MEANAANQRELSEQQIKYFQDNGFLVIRNAVSPKELELLRSDADLMIKNMDVNPGDEDHWFNDEIPEEWYQAYGNPKKESVTKGIPFRVEYPVDKSESCQILMGHPFVLRSVEQLLNTKDFIPTWDSMVFKVEGNGVPIKWHRDASSASVDDTPAIDIGFYLDEANTKVDNCLYVIPGSHKWPDFLASSMIEHLIDGGFKKTGAIPVPVNPGDVILHNILVLHGSPACTSPLRRTVYFEYRAIDQEIKMGPHVPQYIPLKQELLKYCLNKRSKTDYDKVHGNHEPYQYTPSTHHTPQGLHERNYDEPLPTLRFPHKTFFRSDYKG